MAFDFAARAAARQQKESADRLRKQAAEEKRWARAADLETAFLRYAKAYLYRENMVADRQGPSVTFRDGEKGIEVTVMDPPWFNVVRTTTSLNSTLPPPHEPVKFDSEDVLMDMLDAWALEK